MSEGLVYGAVGGLCLLGSLFLINVGITEPKAKDSTDTNDKDTYPKMVLKNTTSLSPVKTNQLDTTMLSFKEDGKSYVGCVQHPEDKKLDVKPGEEMTKEGWEKKLTPAGAYYLYNDSNSR